MAGNRLHAGGVASAMNNLKRIDDRIAGRCSCRGDSLDHLCRVHGNHPSNIVPEHDPGDCDNTRGYSPEGERE